MAAPAAPSVVGPDPQTYAERLLKGADQAWAALLRLDAREATLNLLLSVAVIVFALALVWGLRRLLDHLIGRVKVGTEVGGASEGQETSKAAGVTWLLLRLVVLGCALVLVADIWGVDPWSWLTRGGGRLLRLAVIVVMATAAVELAGFLITRIVEGFARRSADARRASQIRTLGPLLRGSVQSVLIVIGALTVFSELGLKVGPLLASAGVLGIAIGFGAQTLVKDFLTGLFLIAEDVVSLGDNVRIGDSSGTVESMTLRTIRLRSTNGTLHIFPYSEAQVIHNRTKSFSSYVFEFVVSYGVDLDAALAVMGEVGHALMADAELGPLIIRPFEVMGVDRLGESGAVLKARVTTAPREQWRVGREYNRRIKVAFDAHGVEMPFQTIQVLRPPEAKEAVDSAA
jgi:small-conductance mechanosensitive channel